MSNLSSLKNVPPVFQKLTADKVWQVAKQPFSIAILASLGVHGLLWVGLPLLSASTASKPEQRTLNVVELSPLEQQARLPDHTGVSPVPKASPKESTHQETDPLKTSVPLIPLNPDITNTDSFYQVPDIGAGSQAAVTEPTVKKTQPKSKPVTKARQDQQQTQEPDPKDTQTEPDQPDSNKADDPRSTSASDLTDPAGKPLSKGRNEKDKTDPKVALQQLFTFNADGTSDQDFVANSAIAAKAIADKFAIRDWEKPLQARAPYPKDACQFQTDGKPVSGMTGLVVVMQADGSLSDTALQVKSSGFKGLDEAARKFVEKHWDDILKDNKIEANGKVKAFPLAITTEPSEDICKGASKPTSAKDLSQPTS